jgi:putative transcriptional regulator
MTITHHPSNATLAEFAAGALDEGRRLAVATHLAACAACRKAAAAFESVGGVALADSEPAAMKPDALERALATVAMAPPSQAVAQTATSDAPAPLSSYGLGSWRWIGPGIYWRAVNVPASQDTKVFMLKAAPGSVLPHHKHTGAEWTCILQGAFRHEGGRYGEGDFDEADEADEHRPVVEEGVECICLVAMQGQLRFQGWIGRMLQPFVRI